jgi:integrase
MAITRYIPKTPLPPRKRERVKLRLTDAAVAKLAPTGQPYITWDSELGGFGCMVSKLGIRSWIVQRGSMPRRVIERCDLMKAAEAREVALDWLRALGRRIDPKAQAKVEQAKAAAQAWTVAEVLDAYLAGTRGGSLSDTTGKMYRQMIGLHWSDWADRPICKLTDADLVDRHAEIIAKIKRSGKGTGAASANLALTVMAALVRFANRKHRGLIDVDATGAMRGSWATIPRRQRMPDPEKLPILYLAVQGLENDMHRDILTLFCLTGLRHRELLEMTWDELDLDRGILSLPAERTKSKRGLKVPLSTWALRVLRERRALGRDPSGCVFPGRQGRFADPAVSLARVGTALGHGLSSHDLRRLFVTLAELRAGVSRSAWRELVGHSRKTGGDSVSEGYVILDIETLRRAAEAIADCFAKLCGLTPGGNVVPMKPLVAA